MTLLFFPVVSYIETGKASHRDDRDIWKIREDPCVQSKEIQDLWRPK